MYSWLFITATLTRKAIPAYVSLEIDLDDVLPVLIAKNGIDETWVTRKLRYEVGKGAFITVWIRQDLGDELIKKARMKPQNSSLW
jgi:hypothetical protein